MCWLTEHYIEIFGAITGIIYVFLEIKRNILLWPLGLVTSAVYIYVFYQSKFYADMGLQWYYLVISIYGWIIWSKSKEHGAWSMEHGAGNTIEEESEGRGEEEKTDCSRGLGVSRGERKDAKDEWREANNDKEKLKISNIRPVQALWLGFITLVLFAGIWFVLTRFTDSPVPGWDAFTTALSVTATWMLARKILEHWFLWMIVNVVSIGLYIYKGLYPTVILFIVYALMAFAGYREWRKNIN